MKFLSGRWISGFLILIGGATIFLTPPEGSTQEFPVRPITIVAPFPPGGSADLHARALAPSLEQILKQPVVVVNKSGAGGALGAQAVAVSRTDGYTLLLALSFLSYYPEVDILFDRVPTFKREQFTPIAMLSKDPAIFAVKASSPWKSMADVVAEAKSRPEGIRYGSAGFYSTLHLAMEMFTHAAGIKMRHIPYAGGGPATMALLGGHVDAISIPPSVVFPQIKAGTIRILAGWGDRRIAAIPDVPTLKELGYDCEFFVWAGLFAPQATPPAALKILKEATRKAVEDPAFKSAMDKFQSPVVYRGGEEFQKFWEGDARRLSEVVRRIGKVQ